jgi:hypothetical protein
MSSAALFLPRIYDVFRVFEVETILPPQDFDGFNLVAGVKVSLRFVDSVEKRKRLAAVRTRFGFAADLSFAGTA